MFREHKGPKGNVLYEQQVEILKPNKQTANRKEAEACTQMSHI